jgi:ferredoxin/flavodoxin---NADP+ reductase
MFPILEKRKLNDSMTLMVVDAPFIAKKAKAGQFIILRVNEFGERIPLTIADYDREKGYCHHYLSNRWKNDDDARSA